MRILLADDHDLFADMTKFYLERLRPGVSVEVVPSFPRACAALNGAPFDLVLLDLNMPGMHGLSGLERMIQLCPGIPVVMISGSTGPNDVRRAFRAGAAGFIPKTLSGAALMAALEVVLAGDRYLPASMLSDGPMPKAETGLAPESHLTPRENEVFEALLSGGPNKEIARDLGISEITVKVHLKSIYAKIGARNRGEAIRIGLNGQRSLNTSLAS